MDNEVIQAFQDATLSVFKTMLGLDVTAAPSEKCPLMLARHEVSGIIGLSGAMSGDVIVSFDERVAMLATGALLGVEPEELNSDVVDAVGELTNMIAGSAKGALEEYKMDLALPTVVMGAGHRIGFKSGIEPFTIPFDSEWGTFSVEIGLVQAEAFVPSC